MGMRSVKQMAWQTIELQTADGQPYVFSGRLFCATNLSKIEHAPEQNLTCRVAFYIHQDGEVVLECIDLDAEDKIFKHMSIHQTLEQAAEYMASLPLNSPLYHKAFEMLASQAGY